MTLLLVNRCIYFIYFSMSIRELVIIYKGVATLKNVLSLSINNVIVPTKSSSTSRLVLPRLFLSTFIYNVCRFIISQVLATRRDATHRPTRSMHDFLKEAARRGVAFDKSRFTLNYILERNKPILLYTEGCIGCGVETNISMRTSRSDDVLNASDLHASWLVASAAFSIKLNCGFPSRFLLLFVISFKFLIKWCVY